jgi:hypothetical protein
MVEARRGTLAFSVSVPSDGLQGRSRPEKFMHKWLDGEAGRSKYVLWKGWLRNGWVTGWVYGWAEEWVDRWAEGWIKGGV